jgi:hypothetical protein
MPAFVSMYFSVLLNSGQPVARSAAIVAASASGARCASVTSVRFSSMTEWGE